MKQRKSIIIIISLKEWENKDKYIDLARELKKAVEHESWRTGRNYPNDNIAENGQNTEKNPGELRKLAVTQTPVKIHQLTLMWKTLKKLIIGRIIISQHYWRLPEYGRESWKLEETCSHSKSNEKPSANTDVKNSKGVNDNNNNNPGWP